jgi:hypothetical protein
MTRKRRPTSTGINTELLNISNRNTQLLTITSININVDQGEGIPRRSVGMLSPALLSFAHSRSVFSSGWIATNG